MVNNRAGTYWFHPHPHQLTGPQVYYGLAGLFLVSDEEEDAAGLPTGEYDIPLVIQDRTFDADNRLVYLPFTAGGGGVMGGMMGGMGGMMGNSGALPNGARFDVLQIRIEKKARERYLLPEILSTISRYQLKDSVNAQNPRNFDLFMQQMTGTINGRSFQMDAVADDEVVRLNDLEVWQFANLGGGIGMMGGGSLPHPMHVHGVQFQVLERQVERAFKSDYGTVSAGFVDDGWMSTDPDEGDESVVLPLVAQASL